jgi:large subunit ribosomal protein L5
MARLEKLYKEKIVPTLVNDFKYSNKMQVPKLQKIVVSMGVGRAALEKKRLEHAVRDLTALTGQKPLVCKARKSVSNFKLRQGMEIGAKVTLRGKRMFEFLDRLVSLAIPRVRDFRGLNPDAFDGHGNYNLGLTEQLVFPELNPDKFTTPQGMNITLVTSAVNDDESRELLRRLGMPLRAAV